MVKQKIRVGSYYKFTWSKDHTLAFAVMYGFDSGKNKDVYALMMYAGTKSFEFPIHKSLFETWVDEGRVQEITSDEALAYALDR